MKGFIYLVVISFFVLATACKKQKADTIKAFSLSEFDTLQLESVFEVYLIQGNTNSIKLVGAQQIVENVSIEILNNTLKVSNAYKGNWLHPSNNKIKLYITVNQISKIIASESCQIKSLNALIGNEIGLIMSSKYNSAELELDCKTFYYWNNFPCGGQIKLSGNTNELKIWNVALMAIDARELKADIVSVSNSSKGDCKVTCSQKISYKITGSGNIYLKGNPSLIEKIEESSSGKLIIE
jgi:Putative auto-transporter adhesin, head GIN domain